MTSAFPRFYRLTLAERRARVLEHAELTPEEADRLKPDEGLSESDADRMVENAVGVFGLPLGLCVNLTIDGRDVVVPMAVEEPSVIAACSYASKLLRGGITTEASAPIVEGQIQVLDVPDPARAEAQLLQAEPALLELANQGHPRLRAAGGGARKIRIRHLAPEDTSDPCGPMLVVQLAVDVGDAMGANAVNTMCERLGPRVAELTGGRVALRILTNLSDQRTVSVTGRVPMTRLDGVGGLTGPELAQRIVEASVFAERDPYRACTHNKGIMNGVDAALLAFGQDWRAVEAGAHAYAARGGRYTALARWRIEDDALVGRMTLPLAVGTVGGVARTHPVVGVNRRIAGIEEASFLGRVCAAVGLAQNLAALRALAAEGIQKGHMRLHARNVATEAGATGSEVFAVAERIGRAGKVSNAAAQEALAELRAARTSLEKGAERPTDCIDGAPPPPTPVRRPPNPPSAITSAVDRPFDQESEQSEPMNAPNPEKSYQGKVLVTGAAGHLGANLVRRLLADGRDVRVLLRRSSNNAAMDGLDVERVWGDLRDPGALPAAVRGCETVFHCAAQLSTAEPTPAVHRELFDSNVLGTRHLLQACRDASIERVVVTGSFSAVGYDLDDLERPGNEDMPHWPFEAVLPYARTKVLVEHEALKACVEGLDVVIATSCAILGPNDYKPSRMGQTLLDFSHGRMPAFIPGGFDFVATTDIVNGHLLAMSRGRTGQKYIVSTQYLEVDELMAIFEEVTGRPRPRLRIPASVMLPVSEVSSTFLGTLFPNRPQRLTPGAVRILRKRRHADTTKAQRELGYVPGSVRDAVHQAYEDFARRGLVPARVSRGETAVPPKTTEAKASSTARVASGH